MTDTNHEIRAAEFPPVTVIEDTVHWLEKAVIGLNLCPFAKGVHIKGQIHYTVSQATDAVREDQQLLGGRLAFSSHVVRRHRS